MLRVTQEVGRRAAEWMRAVSEIVPPLMASSELKSIDADRLLDRETRTIGLQREMVDELTALRHAQEARVASHAQHDAHVHLRSNADTYPTAAFWKAVGMLLEGEDLTLIAAETGLSYNKVVRIRNCRAHPGELGLGGSPGYRLFPGETSSTLVLRSTAEVVSASLPVRTTVARCQVW